MIFYYIFYKEKLVLNQNGTELIVANNNVVLIKPLEHKFIDKLNASLDLGYTLTKANNLRQFTTRSNLGYLTDNWNADASLDAVRSSQDSIANTERTEYFTQQVFCSEFTRNCIQGFLCLSAVFGK